MLYLLILLYLCLPAAGLWTLENGGLAPMLDFPYGYPNGATHAYLIHALCFALGGLVVLSVGLGKRGAARPEGDGAPVEVRQKQLYLVVTAVIFCGLALLTLASGGLEVLTGVINKADLRVVRHGQGLVGNILTVALKWYMPCAFAVFAFFGRDFTYKWTDRLLLGAATVALIITALSTGYKTTVLFVFQPYLVLRFWRVGAVRGFIFVSGAIVITTLLAYVFDGARDFGEILTNLKERATNYQGDLAWGIWEKAAMGEPMPPYARTYLSIPGSRFLTYAVGVDQTANPAEFASYYFGPAATLFGGYPIEGVEQGVNNQATLFGEAVIAAGPKWFMIFSLGAGIVFGFFTRLLRRFVRMRNPVYGPVWATFLCTNGLMWLIGNGAASMFYVINIAGLLAAGGYIYLFLGSRRAVTTS